MSDVEYNAELLSHDFQNQYLSPAPSSGDRRGSESSESSLASSVAGARRRSTRERGSQGEGSSRKMKGVFPKVRTGCDTCKRRKIKCDEERPECRKCVKSKLHCAGYHPPQANIFNPSISPSKLSDSSTERLCSYFRTETAQRLASYQSLHLNLFFWQSVVPTMADGCAPIRHAMLALAAMQEYDETQGSSQTFGEKEREHAWEQYGAALKKLRSGMSSKSISDDAFLVCCLLLILCHLWDFDLLQCFRHVLAGLQICQHVKRVSSSKKLPSSPTETYGGMLMPAFQHFADCGFVLMDDMDEAQFTLVNGFVENVDIPMPTIFAQTDHASATMDTIIRRIAKVDTMTPTDQLTELSSHLTSLRFTLQQNLALAYTGTDLELIADLRMLLVHDRAASILLSGWAAGNEMVYDQHLIDFEFVLSEMEDLLQIHITAEGPSMCTRGVWMGILPPLFLTATKCRNYALRQRAINLMHVAPHEEYIWTSCIARQIAMEVVRFEETHRFLNAGSFSGYETRVALQAVNFNTLENRIDLEFELPSLLLSDPEPDLRRSAIDWQPKVKRVPVEPFYMPQKMVRACGYSMPMVSFRGTGCHCGTAASPTTSKHPLQTIIELTANSV